MPQTGRFSDKTIASDCLSSQKFLTSAYNAAITESASEQLRRDFMNIYQEEQSNLKQIFEVMHSRGWYQLNTASPQDISHIQQQFRNETSQATERTPMRDY
jgi:spore coat protein CotF